MNNLAQSHQSKSPYPLKFIFDFVLGVLFSIIFAPVIILIIALVWFEDRHMPIYFSRRRGKSGNDFLMLKIRSMKWRAASLNDASIPISNSDRRVTKIGAWLRCWKLDELVQLIHVLSGRMSLVGPRPHVPEDRLWDNKRADALLSVKPGLTDFSSILFADIGELIAVSPYPSEFYASQICAWKQKLGELYINNRSLTLDFMLIISTCLAFFSRHTANRFTLGMLKNLGVDITELNRIVENQESVLDLQKEKELVIPLQRIEKNLKSITNVNAATDRTQEILAA